jgi:Tol biopolymer transport system component
MRRWVAIAAGLLLGALLSTGDATGQKGSPGSVLPRNGKIVFTVDGMGGRTDLCLMSPDGKGRKRLTRAAGGDAEAAWSPDGRRLAFSRNKTPRVVGSAEGRDMRIYLMRPDRSTRSPSPGASDWPGDGTPVWSPDGGSIAFLDYPWRGFGPSLWAMRADGTQRRKLLSLAGKPSWSPDGRTLVSTGVLDGVPTAVSSAGEIRWRLDGSGWRFSAPAWSPDGREIALAGSKGDDRGIFLVDADGTDLRRITLRGTSPIWSPDSSMIAFADPQPFDRMSLQVVGRSGDGLREVAFDHRSAIWSPDGTRLAYSHGGDLFTVAPDGSKARRLTSTIGIDEDQPAWQPVRSDGVANAWAKSGSRLC